MFRNLLNLGATGRRSSRFGAIALCGLTLAVIGCGASERATRSVRLDAARDGSLRFERSAVSTTPGRVSVEMANPSDIPHAIGIRGDGIEESGDTVGSDAVSRVEADLKPGTYTLFCPVAGHEEAGMTARLTVR